MYFLIFEKLINVPSCSPKRPFLNFASNITRIERINKLLLPLKSTENHRFTDDFRGNRS